jgi:hypothetical protein
MSKPLAHVKTNLRKMLPSWVFDDPLHTSFVIFFIGFVISAVSKMFDDREKHLCNDIENRYSYLPCHQTFFLYYMIGLCLVTIGCVKAFSHLMNTHFPSHSYYVIRGTFFVVGLTLFCVSVGLNPTTKHLRKNDMQKICSIPTNHDFLAMFIISILMLNVITIFMSCDFCKINNSWIDEMSTDLTGSSLGSK